MNEKHGASGLPNTLKPKVRFAYAAGFIYAHSLGMPLKVCGEIGSIIAAKVVEVVGTKIDIPRWKAAKQEIRELIAANS